MWTNKSSRLTPVDPADKNRDWNLIQHLLADAFSEQKRARRWGVVFKLLTFTYLFVLIGIFYVSAKAGGVAKMAEPHVGVVRLEGVIEANGDADAGKIGKALRNAFESDHSKAVVLAINSPGGSPVHSGYIYDEIVRLKGMYPDKPLYAVISDIGASGGYYVAAAADKIFANKASLVGSIGVTASGFGFVGTMEKLGVERRHFTAGDHKAFLDPFSPVKEEEKVFWQDVLQNVHQQFIDAVKHGRGDRIEVTPELTSGLIWDGEQALALGLIDGLGGVRFVAREVVGIEELNDYTVVNSPLRQLVEELGVAVGRGIGLSWGAHTNLKLH